MESIPYIFVGGGLGAVMRYALGQASQSLAVEAFWGTLTANVVGGLLMGVLMGWMAARDSLSPPVQLGLTVGLLGGLTTFSTFSHEVVQLFRGGDASTALLYALGSLVVCISLCFVGVRLSTSVWG